MLQRRQDRQRAILALLSAVALAVTAALTLSRAFDPNLQAAVHDTFIAANPVRMGNQMTVVAVDDATVERYGRWPLPRQAYAELLDVLAANRPSAIAFDIALIDPSDRPEHDQALAEAIRRAGNVILPMQGAGPGETGGGTTRYSRSLLPLPLFRDAAMTSAAVNVWPDRDGRLRSVPLQIDAPQGRTYSMPLVAAAQVLRADLSRATVQGDRLILPTPLRERSIPIDHAGRMPVYYATPPTTRIGATAPPCARGGELCIVSLREVVAGEVPARLLQGRLILVGAHSISSVPDDYPVPNSAAGKMFGVEVWAHAVHSILTDRYPMKDQGALATLGQAALAVILGILLVARWRLFGLLGGLGLLLVWAAVQFFVFSAATADLMGSGPLPVPSLGYLVPAAFWWVIALGYILVEEQLSLARTQATFGRFVTPLVARTILEREDAGQLLLGGEEKRVTVLFGDVRGFTTLSEGMSPAELLDTLNRYFEGMVGIIERYQGTVNKYNGDNIMVLWGAPLEVPDPARRAVECALELQRFIVAERANGGPEVGFGFGINTGPVVAGFLGARGRMEYTVIGDTANVASRVTASDIARRDQVVVSGATLAELGDDLQVLSLGAMTVRGRREPVHCYQVDRLGSLANPNPAPPPERPVGQAAPRPITTP